MSWLKSRHVRDVVEPRDRSGPMDIDEPDPLARLDQYALPDQAYGEGPSRKRLHSDLSTPTRPFTAHNRTLHVTPATPFLFNVSNLQVPPMPEMRPFHYDPSKFRGNNGEKLEWGFEPRAGRFGEDVDMSDSPAKPGWGSSLAQDPPLPSAPQPAVGIEVVMDEEGEAVVREADEGEALGKHHKAGEESHADTADGVKAGQSSKGGSSDTRTVDTTGRVYATGGAKRELRNRSRRRQNRAEGNGTGRDDYSSRRRDQPPSLRPSEIPALLIGYIQVFVNVAIVVFALYLGVHLVLTIRRDVKDRMQEASLEMRQEIAECTKLFVTNRCDPEFRVPAMEEHCRNWENCMNRDPTMVGRINVMAETFAGVINSFVEAMSWKTMGFTLATLSFLIILTNSALWNLRQRASPDPQHPPPVYVGMLPHPSFGQRGYPQIGGPLGQTGQSLGSIAHAGVDWSAVGAQAPDGVKQIEYGQDKGKSRWKIW